MTKFAFETLEDTYPAWAKHHEIVGIHVKRVYEDGEEVITKDEALNALVKANESELLSKQVHLYKRGEDKRITATDYFLPLKNQELKKTVSYFQTGASNTKQEVGIRYKFLLEDALFILEHKVTTSNNYPLLSFLDEYSLKEKIKEIAEDSDVKTDGIGPYTENNMVSIVVVGEAGDADIIEIEVNELVDHLVAVEIFEYEMSIID